MRERFSRRHKSGKAQSAPPCSGNRRGPLRVCKSWAHCRAVGRVVGRERERAAGVVRREREGQILQGKPRGESPPFTRGSALARFPGNVDLSAVFAGDFFSWRLLLTVAWIQLLFRWKKHGKDVDAATGPQYLNIKAEVYANAFRFQIQTFRDAIKHLKKKLQIKKKTTWKSKSRTSREWFFTLYQPHMPDLMSPQLLEDLEVLNSPSITLVQLLRYFSACLARLLKPYALCWSVGWDYPQVDALWQAAVHKSLTKQSVGNSLKTCRSTKKNLQRCFFVVSGVLSKTFCNSTSS